MAATALPSTQRAAKLKAIDYLQIGMGKSTDIRQKEIIEATMALAAEQGISRLTTQAIADRVGIAQPTIFRHFKTRDAIFGAAIGWIAENLVSVLDELATAQLPPDERLRQLLQRQLAFVEERRGIPRLLFSEHLHVESPELKGAAREIFMRIFGHISGLLQEGIAQGRFRADLEPRQTALMIGALMQGTLIRWSLLDFGFSLRQEFHALWDFLWPTLRPRND